MPSVSFPKEWPLLTSRSFGVPTSDVALHCWTRRRGVANALNALPVFGGQTLFVATDTSIYVDSRAVRPHLGLLFEGAISPVDPTAPPVIFELALNLRVVQETGGALVDERAIVPSNHALTVLWEGAAIADSAPPITDDQGDTAPAAGWQWRLTDAITGAMVKSGVATTPNVGGSHAGSYQVDLTVPDLGSAARCYLFHVAAGGVKKPYHWPSDYITVTGESQLNPDRFTWTHPVLGDFSFDPRYQIGALPYDRTDPVQAALLDALDAVIAAEKLTLRPEWADYLITFNSDGSQTAGSGEFSCLKIQAAPAWCGDTNVHISACSGISMWTGDEVGNLTPLVVEPRLRSVHAMWEEADGTFWITGEATTRNGLQAAIIQPSATWTTLFAAYGDPFADGFPTRDKSRAIVGARACRAVRREHGMLTVVTHAGKMRVKTRAGSLPRLVKASVGGRSAAQLVRLDGTEINAHLADTDLALGDGFGRFGVPTGDATVVYGETPYPGPQLAKQLSSALCAKETFWGVVTALGKEGEGAMPVLPSAQVNKQFLDDQQGLARFTLGGVEIQRWWLASVWDMARVVPWAGGVYVFGFNSQGLPRAHRFTGDGDGLLEMGLSLPYLVTWGECGLVPDGQSETLRVIGTKFFGRRQLPGSYAAEGTYGSRGAGGVTAGAGASTSTFSWSTMQNAFTISRADAVAAGFVPEAFPPYLQWNAAGAAWIACALAPTNHDGTPKVPYLIYNGAGDPLKFSLGPGVTLPQNVTKFCGLRFTAGTCQGVVTAPPYVEPTCGKMDVAFVVDSTGSMSGAIQNVRLELAKIVADIEDASGSDYRMSLVTFKDDVTVEIPFAPSNGAAMIERIGTITASGGDGTPEASDEAVNTCVRELSHVGRPHQTGDFAPFRADARKIVILVTDALPGSFTDAYNPTVQTANVTDISNAAVAKGILISAVSVPGSTAAATATIMEIYSSTTGGLFVTTQADGQGAADAISDVVNSCGGSVTQSYEEFCTDDLVIPVSCSGSAGQVLGSHTDGTTMRVGVFRVTSPGPINAVWFQEKSNPAAFAAMCAAEQRLWGRINGTAPVAITPAGALSSGDIAALGEFNIPIPLEREFWLPRQAKTFEIAVIVDVGISVEAELGAVH